MRIEKIDSIKYFRNFLDFKSDVFFHGYEDKDGNFKNIHNAVIYSPNGVGKTNLSRLFECISKEECDLDNYLSREALEQGIKGVNFSIQVDGNKINNFNYKDSRGNLKHIYIFNSDFVERSIKTSDFSNKKIEGDVGVPLGEVSNEIQYLENEISDKEVAISKIKADLKEAINSKKNSLVSESIYKKTDYSIWSEYSLNQIFKEDSPEFTIPHKNDKHDSCEADFEKIKGFSDEDQITLKIKEVDVEKIQKIYSILSEPKEFFNFDKNIESSIKYITSNWLKSGHDLLNIGIVESEKVGKCLLCKRDLNDEVQDLFKQYKKYFENEKGLFIQKINRYKNELNDIKLEINLINNNERERVNDFLRTLSIDGAWIDVEVEKVIEGVDFLLTALDRKKENERLIFTIDDQDQDGVENFEENTEEGLIKSFPDILSDVANLNKNIKNNKDIVNKINKKIINTSNAATILRKEIGRKLLYDFYYDNILLFDEIKKGNDEIEENKIRLGDEKKKMPTADKSSAIESLLNSFLHSFLGLDKYSAEVHNNKLILKLKDFDISKETKRLSDAEKNMVGLCYFFASSLDDLETVELYNDAVFIIDDPISSTGYGNFFGICNLLKDFNDEIYKKNNWGDSNGKVQKIILTHNTQFFNMLKNNIFKKKALYLMLREGDFLKLSEKKLLSEFRTSLVRIHKEFIEKDSEDYICANIGNDMRRFFESIRHFYGIKNFDNKSLIKIFPEYKEEKNRIFYSAVNYYSHGNPESDIDSLPPEQIPKLLDEFNDLIGESQFSDLWEEIKEINNS